MAVDMTALYLAQWVASNALICRRQAETENADDCSSAGAYPV
jgi:hypothetical protein